MSLGIIEVYNNKKNLNLTFLFVLLFFFLSALRWERGTDWASYYNLYHYPFALGDDAFEVTYWGMNILFGQILGLDYSVFLTLQAFLLYLLLWIAIKRDCEYPLFALLCLYVILGSGGIFFVRQTISITIVFFSFHYVKIRNLKKFSLCIVAAMFFHRTSIVAFPIYYVYNYSLSGRYVKYIVVGLAGLTALAYVGFFDLILEKFAGYQDDGNDDISSLQYIMGSVNKVAYFCAFLFFKPYVSESTDKNLNSTVNGFMKVYFYGMFLYIFFGAINITLSRLSNFVNIIVVYQVCEWLKLCEDYRRQRILTLVFVFMFVIRSFFSVSEYEDLFVPYKSIFNKELPVNIG